MAKKHVSVSLRKPPPPADLEKLVVEAVKNGPTSDVRELSATSATPITTTTSSATPNVAEPANVNQLDGFVARAKPKSGVCTITVDLPEKVADALATFCAQSGRDVHDVVAEILAKHFAATANEATTADVAPQHAQAAKKMDALVEWIRERIVLVGAIRARLLRLGRMVYASL